MKNYWENIAFSLLNSLDNTNENITINTVFEIIVINRLINLISNVKIDAIDCTELYIGIRYNIVFS